MEPDTGLTVQQVKVFLRSLREGRYFIARVTRGGSGNRYAYLITPNELLKLVGVGLGTRFEVKINAVDGYVDYIVSESGDYTLTKASRAARIRFPLNHYHGYVLIEPKPYGFRVYYA